MTRRPCSICHRRRPSLSGFSPAATAAASSPTTDEPRSQGQEDQIKSSCRGRQRGAGTTELRARLDAKRSGFVTTSGPSRSSASAPHVTGLESQGGRTHSRCRPCRQPLLLPTQTLRRGTAHRRCSSRRCHSHLLAHAGPSCRAYRRIECHASCHIHKLHP